MNLIWHQFSPKTRRSAGLVASGLLAVAIISCANHGPATILIQHPVSISSSNTLGDEIHLRLVTYNIWGLPSWMTGARQGRYPRIARELKRLEPDLILLQEAWTE